MAWIGTECDIVKFSWKQELSIFFFAVLSAASINTPGTVLLFNNCLLNEQKHE